MNSTTLIAFIVVLTIAYASAGVFRTEGMSLTSENLEDPKFHRTARQYPYGGYGAYPGYGGYGGSNAQASAMASSMGGGYGPYGGGSSSLASASASANGQGYGIYG